MDATRGADLQLLGPVRLYVAGRPVSVGVRMQRFVLAVLALEANRLVTTDRLIDLTWSDRPPATARRIIQTQISRLRATLAGVGVDDLLRLRSEPAGYLLDADAHRIDAHRFTALVARAGTTAGGTGATAGATTGAGAGGTTRLAVLDQALGLWRGPALAGTADESTRASLTRHLDEARWTAMEDRLDAMLRQGRDDDVIADAGRLVAEHPYRHRFTAHLMLALYRAGRSVDALDIYRQARERLADEFGLDLPAELQRLEGAIIRNEPLRNLAAAPPVPRRNTDAPLVPRQLPAPAQTFSGRLRELATLEQVHDSSTGVVIVGIDGMAGVGKTALAVQAAHRIADRYPDGQLFIDLHGYTHGIEPIQPADALDHLLRALGVPGTQIPTGLDQRAALYRTRLADQRVLIVLDNAATEAQVAPLLPGAPGSMVLVTSRRRLTGLDQTHTLSLDTLPTPDAIALFVRTAGEGRLAGEPPELLTELAELCGRLPLALRIAATRLRARPAWSLSHLVRRLRDRQDRLGELHAGQSSVTAALELSRRYLSSDQQRAYRLLGLHPGPEFDPYATAALLESSLSHATRTLDQLLEAHLLAEPAPGRYRFHDLTRAHAAAAAADEQTAPIRDAALDRLLDYYRYTSGTAIHTAYPYEREDRPQAPDAYTPVPELPGRAPALNWLDTELSNLLAAARYAADHGRPAHVSYLSSSLHRHLRSRGRCRDAETLHQLALATAGTTGDQVGQLTALVGLGDSHGLQGRPSHAADHYQRALRLARAAGHHIGELTALNGLGHIRRRQGRPTHATDHHLRALRLARSTGHRAGELDALSGLAELHRRQGQNKQSVGYHQQALHLARTTGHRIGELAALNGVGRSLLATHRPDAAVAHYEQALVLAGALNQPGDQARAHHGLADAHYRLNRYEQASHHWRRALDILTGLGIDHTDDEETTTTTLRARLAALG